MKWIAAMMLVASAFCIGGCSSASDDPTDRALLHEDAIGALVDFKEVDPTLHRLLNRAWGYAILPNVGKGAVGVGGGYGRGEVYEHGKLIGYVTLTMASIGASLGGQEYDELLVFENQLAMMDFENGDFRISAEVSAVAVEHGVAESTKFQHGVIVFIGQRGGLMGDASVSSQKFVFEPR